MLAFLSYHTLGFTIAATLVCFNSCSFWLCQYSLCTIFLSGNIFSKKIATKYTPATSPMFDVSTIRTSTAAKSSLPEDFHNLTNQVEVAVHKSRHHFWAVSYPDPPPLAICHILAITPPPLRVMTSFRSSPLISYLLLCVLLP